MAKKKGGFKNIDKGAQTRRLGRGGNAPSLKQTRADKSKQKRIVQSSPPGSARRKAAVKKERQDTFAESAKTGKFR